MSLIVNSLLKKRYRIRQKIVQSGMGILYLAHDEALNVDVAVKENQYTTDLHSRQFHQEATLLAKLRHPNLPRVIDHFVFENQGEYLVMDYIEGINLQESIEDRGKPLQDPEAIRIAAIVCNALVYLHSQIPPIIHQDIKPANLILTPGNDVMLVDFGLAKPYERGSVVENFVQGISPGYSPIEQYGSDTDERSDIYALGATMYTLLTGVTPIESIERAVGKDEIQPIDEINPAISQSLQDVIKKAMAVKAENRFQSTKDFKDQLLAAPDKHIHSESNPELFASKKQENTPTTRHVNVQDQRVSRVKQRKWLWLLPIFFIIFATATAAVITFTNPRLIKNIFQSAALAPQAISTATEKITLQPDLPTSTMISSATANAKEAAPDNSATGTQTTTATIQGTPQGGGLGQIAFVSERTGSPQLFLINIDGSELVQVTSIPEGACQPEWSPDGTLLAYISPCDSNKEIYERASIYVENIETGNTDQVSSLGSGDYDPAWSPDGKQLAFTSLQTGRAQIFVYDFITGESRQLMNNTMVSYMPVWSSDGGQILFVTPNPENNQPTLFFVDSSGQGNPKTILGSTFLKTFRPDWSPNGDMIVFDLPENGQIGSKLLQNNQTETINTPLKLVENPGFSPDANWLVFNGILDATGQDIFYMLRNGEGLTRLTDSPADDYQPAWRP